MIYELSNFGQYSKVELKLRWPKELWGTRIKRSLFLNFAFDCESRKSATSTFTTPPFESNVLQNHKNSWQHWMSDILNIHFRSFFVLYTLPMLFCLWIWSLNLFFSMPFSTFWRKRKIVKICNSCLLWFSFSLADRKKKTRSNFIQSNFQFKTTIYM